MSRRSEGKPWRPLFFEGVGPVPFEPITPTTSTRADIISSGGPSYPLTPPDRSNSLEEAETRGAMAIAMSTQAPAPKEKGTRGLFILALIGAGVFLVMRKKRVKR